jgi:hypothetical protein
VSWKWARETGRRESARIAVESILMVASGKD